MTFMELLSNGSSRHDQELEGEPRSKIHLVLDLESTHHQLWNNSLDQACDSISFQFVLFWTTFESEEIPVMSSLSKQFL